MNRIYTTLFIAWLSLSNLFTQPRISYTIPDVGSPGMGVYVEIIGPTDAFGNFGSDGLYSNNLGRVKIIFDRPGDTSKIIVGPIVVSWQGRMLSTYFFISPNVEEPNSSDWSLLDSKFRIPFRVEVDGVSSNADTFYIVKPYSFGSLLQNNQYFGTGPLGKRSPSGAIVVDNLTFSNLEYKAFLDNSITYPARNRTYLPFIILCKGDVTGYGSNTIINVSGGDGRVQNGGPGGGGGGGRFCDNISGNPGEDGGNGFTSGGKGGVNYFLTGSGAYKSFGCGTGDSGKSFNGVLPASNPGGWEASGGGTGHPFGKSGIGSGDQSNWNVPGGYGGGTGSINNRMGGSGGYSSDGQSEPSNYLNGGKTHGNPMIVPIAGGSGGASGNPSGLNVCSGSGGGGGGAIRIFAKRIQNVSIYANGANGGQSSYGAGGGGSGGSISICAKEVAQNLNLSARGGNGGGKGYFRVDAPSIGNITYSHTDPPAFVGISTDTTTFVKRRFTLSGSKNQSSDSVLIFIKSPSSDWNLQKVVSGFSGQNNWNTEVILPDTSGIFYLCAVQDLGYEVIDTFKYHPRYIQSQAAMNTLHRVPQGICSGTKRIEMVVIDCPGKTFVDSGYIKNIGDGNLQVFFSRARFKAKKGFELISPTSDVKLTPNDSVKFYFRFVADGTNQNGIIRDSLLIEHSDDEWSENPWGIEIQVQLLSYKLGFSEITNLIPVDTLNFGYICKNSSLDTALLFWNRSDFPVRIIYDYDSSKFTLSSKSSFLEANHSDTLRIELKNYQPGYFLDSIIAYPEDCPDLHKKLYVTFYFLDISTDFIYKGNRVDTISIGDVCVGDTINATFYVRNAGNFQLKLLAVDRTTSGDLLLFAPIGLTFGVNQSVENNLTIVPKSDGYYVNRLIYKFDQCVHYDTLVVVYNAVKSQAVVLSGTYFGFVQIGDVDTSVVIIVNKGSGVSYYDTEPPSSNEFKYIGSKPQIPTYLRPGDTLKLVYVFSPASEGEFRYFVEYYSNSQNDCPDTIRFELRGIGTNARIFANVDSVYLGLFPYCKSKDTIIYISNKGTTDLIIKKVDIIQNYPEHFILSNSVSSNVIPPNAIDSCVVKFVGIKGDNSGLKTAELVIESSDVNNPQIRIKLSAYQENLNVDLVPDTLDLGICQIGDSKTKTLKLINNGTYVEPQRIKDFEGNKSVFEPNPTVAVIPPKDSVEINITFKPDHEGEIFDSLRIVYFQPCPDTQWVYLRGWGTAGNFFVNDTLDFGDIVFCSSDTLSFQMVNLGTIPFKVDSAHIYGQDAFNFSILNTFPVIIDSVGSFIVAFREAKEERVYTAFVRLYVFINNATKPVNVYLRANPKRFINFAKNEIDFGQVPIGISRNLDLVLKNEGIDAILQDYFFKSNTGAFSTDLQKNFLIQKNISPQFNATFTPDREGLIIDTLFAFIQYPDCIDTIFVTLKGIGVPPQDVIIRADNVVLDPKAEEGSVPLFIRLQDTTKTMTVGAFEFKVSFYWSIFHVRSADGNGRIIDDKIQNQIREITLQFDSLFVEGKERNFITLSGIPLISDTDFSVVNIYDCNWKQQGFVKNTILVPGSITTTICTEGGKRLVKPIEGMIVNVTSGDNGVFTKIASNYPDVYKIRVFDVLGNRFYEVNVQFENSQVSSSKEILIPNAYLPLGLVLIQISNSNEFRMFKILRY
jgi:hypothetical protein